MGKTVLDLKKALISMFLCVFWRLLVSEEKYHESITFFVLKLYTFQVWDGKGQRKEVEEKR